MRNSANSSRSTTSLSATIATGFTRRLSSTWKTTPSPNSVKSSRLERQTSGRSRSRTTKSISTNWLLKWLSMSSFKQARLSEVHTSQLEGPVPPLRRRSPFRPRSLQEPAPRPEAEMPDVNGRCTRERELRKADVVGPVPRPETETPDADANGHCTPESRLRDTEQLRIEHGAILRVPPRHPTSTFMT
jgi:hypothetical protein